MLKTIKEAKRLIEPNLIWSIIFSSDWNFLYSSQSYLIHSLNQQSSLGSFISLNNYRSLWIFCFQSYDIWAYCSQIYFSSVNEYFIIFWDSYKNITLLISFSCFRIWSINLNTWFLNKRCCNNEKDQHYKNNV